MLNISKYPNSCRNNKKNSTSIPSECVTLSMMRKLTIGMMKAKSNSKFGPIDSDSIENSRNLGTDLAVRMDPPISVSSDRKALMQTS